MHNICYHFLVDSSEIYALRICFEKITYYLDKNHILKVGGTENGKQ